VTKRLTLRREALAELTADDLRIAVGGQSGVTCPVADCVRNLSDALGCVGSYNCPTYDC
jgi:hypothetical protein